MAQCIIHECTGIGRQGQPSPTGAKSWLLPIGACPCIMVYRIGLQRTTPKPYNFRHDWQTRT